MDWGDTASRARAAQVTPAECAHLTPGRDHLSGLHPGTPPVTYPANAARLSGRPEQGRAYLRAIARLLDNRTQTGGGQGLRALVGLPFMEGRQGHGVNLSPHPNPAICWVSEAGLRLSVGPSAGPRAGGACEREPRLSGGQARVRPSGEGRQGPRPPAPLCRVTGGGVPPSLGDAALSGAF